MAARSERVSPTAHATGELWVQRGLSDPGLSTAEGRRLLRAFRWLERGARIMGAGSLAELLEARHRAIDRRLEAAIQAGEITQVVELAAGFSGRGLRLTRRHPGLRYLETDLPHMVTRKRALLDGVGGLSPGHALRVLNALSPDGPESLDAALATLDPGGGTAVIAEGLLNYLPPAANRGLLARLGSGLRRFVRGRLLCDVYLPQDNLNPGMAAFALLVMGFVGGRMYLPFRSANDARRQFGKAGFETVEVHPAAALAGMPEGRGARRVRIVEAGMGPALAPPSAP